MEHLLEVKDLAVSFYGDLGETKAVKNASFYVDEGEVFGIVGESGSGKSVATKSILKLGTGKLQDHRRLCRVQSSAASFLKKRKKS